MLFLSVFDDGNVNLSFNFLRGSVASHRYHCGLRRRMFVFVMTGPG